MQTLLLSMLLYVAVGAACFAHPAGRATPADFGWRGQLSIFLDTLPHVFTWPLALWHLLLG